MRYFFTALVFYSFILPISLLPWQILHALSDGISWLLFSGIGYRKQVVLSQMRASFPEKSEAEIQTLAKKFYVHLTDVMLESIKAFTITEAEMRERVSYHNTHLIDAYTKQGQSVILAAGHFANFEMLVSGLALFTKHPTKVLYKTLANKFFDDKIRQSRGQFGLQLMPTSKAKSGFSISETAPVSWIFAADQSPSDPNKAYWMPFMHQDTAVLYGSEKYARDHNLPVLFAGLIREKRGYYSAHFEVLVPEPRETAYGEITEKITQAIERDLHRTPADWLWSHRRWKHRRPENWTIPTDKP